MLWLGFAVPDDTARTLFEVDPVPAIQTHKFGWSFARSLSKGFDEVILISACPVQNYPLVDRLFFRGESFSSQGFRGVMLWFINFLVLKHLTRLTACLTTVLPLLRRQRIEWVFIHGVHTPYLIFSLLIRLAGYRIVVVLTDPPGAVLQTDGKIARVLKKLDTFLVKLALSRVNGVIALAPNLAERLAPKRPCLVFPGILESKLDAPLCSPAQQNSCSSSPRPFTIVYAGGLSSAYGVDRLVAAVQGIDDTTPVCLKLFGRGDQEDRIRRLMSSDSRIIYGGFVDSDTLWPELCNADLLINPRPTTELFSSLSFPSKLIEYLATGRPVLTTRINSIPQDLNSCYYFIDDESIVGIRNSIRFVIQLPECDRLNFGFAAKEYARTHLSEDATGKKIADFIDYIS